MQKILSACHRIEQIAARIYHLQSQNPTYAAQVRQLFGQLSDDEKAHARNLDLLQQADRQDVAAHLAVSWDKIQQAVALAERYLAITEQGAVDEEQALRMAVDMEQRLIKVHAHQVVHLQNRKLAALFERLGKEDQTHIDRLKRCLTWWHAERRRSMGNA